MRQKLAAYVLVILIFIFTPFVITMLMTGVIEGDISDSLVECRRVNVNYKSGSQAMDISKYMIGVLAARWDESQEIEVLKAESVMVRTDIYRIMGDRMTIDSNDLGMDYLTVKEMKAKWGDSYESNYNLIVDCISATSGRLIVYNGNLIDAKYTYVSAGKTRNGSQINETDYTYFVSVTCEDDITSDNYLKVETFTNENFLKPFTSTYGNMNASVTNIMESIQIVSRDSSEYVVKIQVGNVVMTGEKFAELLGINSSCFYIEQAGVDSVKITTKGRGNGYGVSIYSANCMAKNGNLYEEILRHFYSGISFMSE